MFNNIIKERNAARNSRKMEWMLIGFLFSFLALDLIINNFFLN